MRKGIPLFFTLLVAAIHSIFLTVPEGMILQNALATGQGFRQQTGKL